MEHLQILASSLVAWGFHHREAHFHIYNPHTSRTSHTHTVHALVFGLATGTLATGCGLIYL